MNIIEKPNEAIIKAAELILEYKEKYNEISESPESSERKYIPRNYSDWELELYIQEILLIDPDIYDKILEIPIVKFIEKHLGKGSILHYRIIFSIMLFSLFISKYYLTTEIESIKNKLEILEIFKESFYDPDELADIVYDTYFNLNEVEISDIPHFIENFNVKLHTIFNKIYKQIYLFYEKIIREENMIEAYIYFKHNLNLLILLIGNSDKYKMNIKENLYFKSVKVYSYKNV